MQAFLPGAGLGTRLRPLTEAMPKPLVPLFQRPLVEHALEACRALGVERFAINTHHLADMWRERFSPLEGRPQCGGNGESVWRSDWQGCEVSFFHEPVLLETGGGVKNLAPWVGDESLLVHNADIFANLSLERLVEAHEASGLAVTLALRSGGPALHVAVDDGASRVSDIRGMLGRAEGTHQFTGIYCAGPELLELIPGVERISVIPAFLELAKAGRLGCVVLDEGAWLDLGDPTTLLEAHLEPPLDPGVARIDAGARVDAAAKVDELSWVGAGALVPAGVSLSRSLVLPGAEVPAGCHDRAIFFGGRGVNL